MGEDWLKEAKEQCHALHMVVNTGVGPDPKIWDEKKCVKLFKQTIQEIEHLRLENKAYQESLQSKRHHVQKEIESLQAELKALRSPQRADKEA